MAVNQKAISLRLNLELIAPLDEFCTVNDITRNKAINLAISLLLKNGMRHE